MNVSATGHLVVSGGSGLIGRALIEAARARQIPVVQLVRGLARTDEESQWDPLGGRIDSQVLVGARAVVNLNGASIGRLPWTRSYRRKLISSRLAPTRTLASALQELGAGAPAFISASAVGYYGNQPGRVLTEESPVGNTFLAGICRQWEAEAMAAAPASRVVTLRTAPVVSRQGVLKPMVRLTKLGLGGRLGPGSQYLPWISLVDEVEAILHLVDSDWSGPVNLTGPAPATAGELGRALAKQLHRPYWLPTPAWALRLALGADAADSLLLADARVVPAALLASGFRFQHRTVDEAVAAALAAKS